jgi:hypothetical protein
MGWIQNIRTKAHEKRLKRQMQRRALPKGRDKVNLDNAKQIGVFFRGDAPDQRKKAQQYAESLRKRGKQVRLFAYLDRQDEGEEFAFKHYTKKQIDWAYCPSSPEIKEFTGQAFDLLIHLSQDSSLHEAYIVACSAAKLRVGPSTVFTYAYDLMIDLPENAGLTKFIEQMEMLLGKTNMPHEPANP